MSKKHADITDTTVDTEVTLPTPLTRIWFTVHSIHGQSLPEQAHIISEIVTDYARRIITGYQHIERVDVGLQDMRTHIRYTNFGTHFSDVKDLDMHGLVFRFIADPMIRVECGSELLFYMIVHRKQTLPKTITQH